MRQMVAIANAWARQLKIPAEGGWGCGRGGQKTWTRSCGAVGDILGASDVLDEVDVMAIMLLLVHALAGCTLPLELPPLGGTCGDNVNFVASSIDSQSNFKC